ncbi:MAG: hypothetical protein QM770_16290 [Tepidisphaeraceae bacterium]
MSLSPTTQPFLDPKLLIARSRVLPRAGGRLYLFLVAMLLPLILLLGGDQNPFAQVLRFALPLACVGLFVLASFSQKSRVESLRREEQSVDALDELIQLRRWPEAAEHAQRILGDAMLQPHRRAQALMLLATLLQRYHRFDDARAVHDYLLDSDEVDLPDGSIVHSIKVARAMAMLREDHLVDADRAITDLRRDVSRARDQVRRARQAVAEEAGESVEAATLRAGESLIESAGVVLIELYRDVKTGHYDEAIETFESKQKSLRDQLGHRVGDAWVLAAKAYEMRGQADRAADAYRRATALVPSVELHRRYPETAELEAKYPATAPMTV